MTRLDDDRGQLILIGAVVVALVIVTSATVFNSVLYTQTIAPQGTTVATQQAEKYEQVTRRDVGGLVGRAVHNESYLSESQLDSVRSNLTTYSRRLSEHATSDAAYLNVSYNNSASRTGGTLVHDDAVRSFSSKSGAEDWTLARNVTTISSFRMNITAFPRNNPPQRGRYVINVTNATGAWWRISTYETTPSQNKVVVVESHRGTKLSCTASTSWVSLNATNGSLSVEPCGASTPFVTDVSGPKTLQFVRHENAGSDPKGTYRIDVEGDVEAGNFYNTSANVPYRNRVVYAPAFDITYESASLSFVKTYNIDVDAVRDLGAATQTTVVSYADFEDGTLGPEWVPTGAGPFGVSTDAAHSGAQSAYHNGGGDGYLELSSSVDTSSVDRIVVEYWAQEGRSGSNGPDVGENEHLELQYWTGSTWKTVDTANAVSGDIETYERRVVIDDPDAFHTGFTLRYYLPGDAPSDRWYVDDVTVTTERDSG